MFVATLLPYEKTQSKCLSVECSGIWETKGISGGTNYDGEKAMGQDKQGNGPEYVELVMCISSVHISDIVIRQGIVEKCQSHRMKTFKKIIGVSAIYQKALKRSL